MKDLHYRAVVRWNNEINMLELVLSSDYTRLLDLIPEDEFYLIIEEDAIRLVPFGTDEIHELSVSDDLCVQVDSEGNIYVRHNALSAINCRPNDQFEIRLGRKYISLVRIPTIEMILDLQKRTRACFDECKQILADKFDPPTDIDEAAERVGLEENPELEVRGRGFEIDVFELTKDQFHQISQTRDISLVDSSNWDLRDTGQYSLPTNGCELLIDDICMDFPFDYEFSKGPTSDEKLKLTDSYISTTDIAITTKGRFYAVRVWENKGVWVHCKIRDDYFRPSNLRVNRILARLGEGETSIIIPLFDLQYTRVIDNYGASTNGKGCASYLVDTDGIVIRI